MQSLTLSPSMNTVIEERTWINHVSSNFVSQPLQPDTDVPFEEHMFAVRDETERAIILHGHPREFEFCEMNVRSGFRSHPRIVPLTHLHLLSLCSGSSGRQLLR